MKFDPKVNPDAERILRGLYEFKKALVESNRAFSKDEFLKGLKEIGMPSNCHFWMTLLNFVLPTQKCKLLTRVRKDGYVFTKPKEPIFHGDLQALYNAYSETLKKYQRTYKEKKRQSVVDNESRETENNYFEELKNDLKNDKSEQLSVQIREAIDLLKSNGFEVLAPVAMLYAKM